MMPGKDDLIGLPGLALNLPKKNLKKKKKTEELR